MPARIFISVDLPAPFSPNNVVTSPRWMSKFTPFPGAPIWSELPSEGEFNEDWRQMNCLNFVFVPKTMESREQLDNLYNWHVKRFYMDQGWRNRFAGRLWQHRWSLFHFFRHLPSFLAARRHFEPAPVSRRA